MTRGQLVIRSPMAESLSFERSDRTNQDEKITQEFEPCSGSIDLTRGQFVILGLKAKHDFLNFEWSGRTNQDEKFTHKVLSSNPVKVQICDQRSICLGFEPHLLH